MSTIGTHLNLGASYLINDLYKRFLVKHETDRHYVNASRVATILVAVLSAGATTYMQTHGASIAAAWKFLLALGAGAGLVFMLRWYWWRINAWSEITAMTAAAVISLTLESRFGLPVVTRLHGLDGGLAIAPLSADDPHAFAWLMLITTAGNHSAVACRHAAHTGRKVSRRCGTSTTWSSRRRWAGAASRPNMRSRFPSCAGTFCTGVLGFSLIYLMLVRRG